MHKQFKNTYLWILNGYFPQWRCASSWKSEQFCSTDMHKSHHLFFSRVMASLKNKTKNKQKPQTNTKKTTPNPQIPLTLFFTFSNWPRLSSETPSPIYPAKAAVCLLQGCHLQDLPTLCSSEWQIACRTKFISFGWITQSRICSPISAEVMRPEQAISTKRSK